MNESAAGIVDIPHQAEARDGRQKEFSETRERRSVTSLMKGVRDIKDWANAREISTVNIIGEMSRKMESLAELLVLQRRSASVPDRVAMMDRLIEQIDAFKLGKKNRTKLPIPDDIEPLLNHVEAIPLAMHDLSNGLAKLDIDEQASRKPSLDEGLRLRASERYASGWNSIPLLADETMECFQDPFSMRKEISLSDVDAAITRAAMAQKHVTNLSIDVKGFPSDGVIDGSIHWSTFLLRSIVGNAVQNTLRQAERKAISPQLVIQLSVEPGTNGSRVLTITLQDNAGGFTQDFIDNGTTGYANGAASKGVAMKSLEALVNEAGGKVKYDNVDLPSQNGTEPQKGARTRISLPVFSQVTV